MSSLFESRGCVVVRVADAPFGPSDTEPARVVTPMDGKIPRSAVMSVAHRCAQDSRLVASLLVASPLLVETLERENVSDKAAWGRALSLLRYERRRFSRSTPYGLFASVDPVTSGVVHAERHETAQVFVRPDFEWLTCVALQLEERQDVRAHLHYVVNFDAQFTRGRLQVSDEWTLSAQGLPERRTSSVAVSPPVSAVLRAARRPISYPALAGALTEAFPQVSEQEVAKLIGQLVTHNVLRTDLRPAVTDLHPLRTMNAILANLIAPPDSVVLLRRIAEALETVGRGTDDCTGTLRELMPAMREVAPAPAPFAVDAHGRWEISLPEEVTRTTAELLSLLWRLSRPRQGTRSLRTYHDDFVERYGVGRTVPLSELTDPGRGLGFPAGYRQGEQTATQAREQDPPLPDRDIVLLGLLTRALRDGAREVELDADTLRQLVIEEPDEAQAPYSSDVLVHLVADDEKSIEAGEYLCVVGTNPGGHQAGAASARFLHLWPEEDARTREAVQSQPTTPHGAEIVSLAFQPRGLRAANIAMTRPWPGREIRVGIASTGSADCIGIDDLAVGATLERLYLVDTTTGREVCPVTTTMVNYATQAPPIARLLQEIGLEGQRLWEPWDWGSASASPFLPRVRVGRCVLFSATWKTDELRPQVSAHPRARDWRTWRSAVSAWRERWGIPRWVNVLSSDQKLLLNLEDDWDLVLLHEEIRSRSHPVVQELPGGASMDRGWVCDRSGRPYTAEFAVSLAPRRDRKQVAPCPAFVPSTRPAKALRGAMGDWVYCRLRVPYPLQDDFLRHKLPEFLGEAGPDLSSWWFLRYGRPRPHLRLRVHGTDEAARHRLLDALDQRCGQWRADGWIPEWDFAEYDPEFERYGGLAVMEALHDYFATDSAVVLQALGAMREDDSTIDLCAALLAADLCATAKDLPRPEKRDDWAHRWLPYLGTPGPVLADVRARRQEFAALIDPVRRYPALKGSEFAFLAAVLPARRAALAHYLDALRGAYQRGESRTPPERIVGSLVHMTCNRLFGGPSDREERVIQIARTAVEANFGRRSHLIDKECG